MQCHCTFVTLNTEVLRTLRIPGLIRTMSGSVFSRNGEDLHCYEDVLTWTKS